MIAQAFEASRVRVLRRPFGDERQTDFQRIEFNFQLRVHVGASSPEDLTKQVPL